MLERVICMSTFVWGGSRDARPSRRSGSWAQEDLDRLALVHRAVAVGGLVERQRDVEDLAGVDLAVPDEVDQLGQEAPHWGRPAVDMGEAPEQVHAVQRDAMGDADEPDMAAG